MLDLLAACLIGVDSLRALLNTSLAVGSFETLVLTRGSSDLTCIDE
jgi:hypothetical protein